MKLCVLCGKSLDQGGRVNREHYVPQVVLRNFRKLKVPESYSHALRIDLRKDDGEILLAPKSCHKEWATVKVHEKCNLDASGMCQDLKYIIDRLDNCPKDKTDRILDYYAHLWGLEHNDLIFRIIPDEELQEYYNSGVFGITHAPGYFWVGKIVIGVLDPGKIKTLHDYEKHTIFMGPKKALERAIKDYEDGREPEYANPYSVERLALRQQLLR